MRMTRSLLVAELANWLTAGTSLGMSLTLSPEDQTPCHSYHRRVLLSTQITMLMAWPLTPQLELPPALPMRPRRLPKMLWPPPAAMAMANRRFRPRRSAPSAPWAATSSVILVSTTRTFLPPNHSNSANAVGLHSD